MQAEATYAQRSSAIDYQCSTRGEARRWVEVELASRLWRWETAGKTGEAERRSEVHCCLSKGRGQEVRRRKEGVRTCDKFDASESSTSVMRTWTRRVVAVSDNVSTGVNLLVSRSLRAAAS